jgi:thioesterase domain-containing protein
MKAGGALEYLGRIDHQVKIRGFRIELGEIEAVLESHPGVQQSAAIVREDRPGDRKLVAYVVRSQEANLRAAAELKAYLRVKLPEYMIPAAIVLLDKLPLTTNGKLDHKQLPPPEMSGDEQSYIAPRNAVEEVLCGLFAEALGLRRRISIHENFFELGGDSFLAVRMIARARESGLNFSVKDLFIHQTVADLAQLDTSATHKGGLGSILVRLRSAGSKPPLFFVHPMGGGIDFLFSLVRRLEPDRPIYGIRSGGLNGEAYHPEFDELITEYIGHIKSVQKDGPYFLSGYSSGGTIAFAIALRLTQQGDAVALLGQIDSEILPPIVDEDTIEIMEVLSFAKLYTEESVSAEELGKAPQGQRLSYLLERIKPSTSSFNYAQVCRVAPVWQAHRKTMWSFRARIFAKPEEYRYPGRIILFKTEQPVLDSAQAQSANARWLNSPTGNWEEFAPGRVHVRMIPGRHNTCILEPHVKDLALQLSSALQQAE